MVGAAMMGLGSIVGTGIFVSVGVGAAGARAARASPEFWTTPAEKCDQA